MANRQYIGARYVPKLYDGTNETEWDANVTYEPLTIVTYLGNSYTSKKAVPAGVGNPIDNPTYWASTGNYNAQVEQYRQDTVKVANDLQELRNDTTNDLQELRNDTTNKINSINSPNLRNMSTRKFVFVGDSYTQVPTPLTSFVGVCATILGLNSNQYHNIGVSGVDMSGFITEVNDYNFSDNDEITDVVITGGINDAHYTFTETNLRTTIPALLSAVKSKFPNAVIWAGWSGGGYYTNPSLVATYPNFTYENVQNIKFLWDSLFSSDRDVIYMNRLDEWWRVLADTDIYRGGSGLHPNNFGVQVLATNVANYLKGGGIVSANLTANADLTMSTALSISLGTNGGAIVANKYDNYEELYIPWRGMNLSTPIELSNNDLLLYKYDLDANVERTAVATNKPITISAPLTYYTTVETSIPKIASAVYTFTRTNVYVKIPDFITPITNVSSIWVPDLRFLVPANAM